MAMITAIPREATVTMPTSDGMATMAPLKATGAFSNAGLTSRRGR